MVEQLEKLSMLIPRAGESKEIPGAKWSRP
jgi:hypothetical protein